MFVVEFYYDEFKILLETFLLEVKPFRKKKWDQKLYTVQL